MECGKCNEEGKLTFHAVCDLKPVSGSSPCALKFERGMIDQDVPDEKVTVNRARKERKPRR